METHLAKAVIPLLTTQGQQPHRSNEVLLATYLQRDTEKWPGAGWWGNNTA